jgi:hypothetical protein
LYRSSLVSRAGFAPIHVLLALLAGCDGTLQFSGPTAGTGGAAGQAEDASDVADARPDETNEATTVDASGFAPPCHKDTDCPVNKLHCDLASNACVECVGNSDCNVDPYLRCETTVHRCVECVSPADCAPGATCDPATRICIASCRDGGACPAAQPYCDGRGSCVECRSNADCFRPDLCDLSIGRCAFCAADQECAAPNVRCDPYNPGRSRCKQCLIPADCPVSTPYCDVHGGICMAGPARDAG